MPLSLLETTDKPALIITTDMFPAAEMLIAYLSEIIPVNDVRNNFDRSSMKTIHNSLKSGMLNVIPNDLPLESYMYDVNAVDIQIYDHRGNSDDLYDLSYHHSLPVIYASLRVMMELFKLIHNKYCISLNILQENLRNNIVGEILEVATLHNIVDIFDFVEVEGATELYINSLKNNTEEEDKIYYNKKVESLLKPSKQISLLLEHSNLVYSGAFIRIKINGDEYKTLEFTTRLLGRILTSIYLDLKCQKENSVVQKTD